MRRNEGIIKKAEQDLEAKKSREMSQYMSRLDSARQRESHYEKLCNQSDVVSAKDKHISCVNYLIDQLSTGRADSLKEALISYDNYMHQKTNDFIHQQNEWWAQQNQAQALANMQNAQTAHNYHVRNELKKQTREMEEINERLKKLDD